MGKLEQVTVVQGYKPELVRIPATRYYKCGAWEVVKTKPGNGYNVSHIPTGLAAVIGIRRLDDAQALMWWFHSEGQHEDVLSTNPTLVAAQVRCIAIAYQELQLGRHLPETENELRQTAWLVQKAYCLREYREWSLRNRRKKSHSAGDR